MSIEELQKEYQEKRGLYEELCEQLATQISELLREARITTASPIEHRVKSWESIVHKIERNQIKPKDLGDIRDVAGLRMVAVFQRDLATMTDIIEKHFQVLHKEDTMGRLDENQFGYGSIHYELNAPPEWFKVPTLKKLQGLCAEIQVRTGSQHIWAAASHLLQYKREAHVPVPLRRSINRVAALLETVDLEFERVLVERGHYVEQIDREEEHELLNTESLRRVLDKGFPDENRAEDESYGKLVDDFTEFKVKTTTELKTLIEKHKKAVERVEASKVAKYRKLLAAGKHISDESKDRVRRGVFLTHMGLARHLLRAEFGDAAFEQYFSQKSRARKPMIPKR